MWRRVALIGFSGSGKTTTARLLADQLGWFAIDLDEDLEHQFGMTIPEVFATHSEPAFRQAERGALVSACSRDQVVIATGGGAAAQHDAWSESLLGHPETLTVTLDASPGVSLRRLQEQQASEGDAVTRPMIEVEDPLTRITNLKGTRQDSYDRAAITLVVDNIEPDQVAGEIANLLQKTPTPSHPNITLEAPGGRSSIFVYPGILNLAGEFVRDSFPGARRAWVISDTNVAGKYAPSLSTSLENAGLPVSLLAVPSGESSKSLERAGELYDSLLDGGVERSDIVLALGGGVIGDLAGFVAATVLRGIGLVQVPTSLLAMVDSSVGGKTGINHRAGKNLIGSFYHPPLVLIDPLCLRSLPFRELNQGWAEVIKHAVIQQSTPGGERADLLSFLRRNAGHLLALEEPSTSYLIRRNVELKCRVVEADERESGIRAFLNFGHTLGHAIEASDYKHLHGEAVALGMRAAASLSIETNQATPQSVSNLNELLDRFGLPATTMIDTGRVLDLMRSDKKRVSGSQLWVLMKRDGGVELRQEITEEQILAALRTIDDTSGNRGN